MNIAKNEPSPSVQALIASRYTIQPGCITPGEYDEMEQAAKQIARELSAQMSRIEPDFAKLLIKANELSDLAVRLRDTTAALRRQTSNQKLPRPYVRVKVDHSDEIERCLIKAIENLKYGESESTLGSLYRHTSDAFYLVRDAVEEARRVRQGE